jgi:hypothetical protein
LNSPFVWLRAALGAVRSGVEGWRHQLAGFDNHFW